MEFCYSAVEMLDPDVPPTQTLEVNKTRANNNSPDCDTYQHQGCLPALVLILGTFLPNHEERLTLFIEPLIVR
eukprot:6473627-Amphidinium_carterae.1